MSYHCHKVHPHRVKSVDPLPIKYALLIAAIGVVHALIMWFTW